MSKNIFYRIPKSYEIDYEGLCGIATSQLKKLAFDTNYEVELIDHSYMMEDGGDWTHFVVKHRLYNSENEYFCYSMLGGEDDEEYDVPKFFRLPYTSHTISIYEVEKLGGIESLDKAMNHKDSFNYHFFF